MKCTRNRSRCQGQNIYICLHLLDLFLMGDAKPLFLIYNQQTELLKCHILGQQPMCSDHDIHLAGFQISNRLPNLLRCTETTQQPDLDRKFLHTFFKCIIMLLCKDRSRHKISNLSAIVYCLKCRTDRNLGLTKAHITTDQTVHNLAALHVCLCLCDRFLLVIRFLIREHFLKFLLPDRILRIAEAL